MTDTLSFRRSVASLSHIRLRVNQSGGVHDNLLVHISSADWWNILHPLAYRAIIGYFAIGGIRVENDALNRLIKVL